MKKELKVIFNTTIELNKEGIIDVLNNLDEDFLIKYIVSNNSYEDILNSMDSYDITTYARENNLFDCNNEEISINDFEAEEMIDLLEHNRYAICLRTENLRDEMIAIELQEKYKKLL